MHRNYYLSLAILCCLSSTAFAGHWTVTRVDKDLGGAGPFTQTGTSFDVATAEGIVRGSRTFAFTFVRSLPLSCAFAGFDGKGETTITATWISRRGEPPQRATHTFTGTTVVIVNVEKALFAFSHAEDDPVLSIGGGGTWSGQQMAESHCNLTLNPFTFPNEDFCTETQDISPTVAVTSSPTTIVLRAFVSPKCNTMFKARASAGSISHAD